MAARRTTSTGVSQHTRIFLCIYRIPRDLSNLSSEAALVISATGSQEPAEQVRLASALRSRRPGLWLRCWSRPWKAQPAPCHSASSRSSTGTLSKPGPITFSVLLALSVLPCNYTSSACSFSGAFPFLFGSFPADALPRTCSSY